MENLSFLIDLKTGEMFSEKEGWNRKEISLRNSREWTNIIYREIGGIVYDKTKRKTWENRRLYYIKIPIPFEPEILT